MMAGTSSSSKQGRLDPNAALLLGRDPRLVAHLALGKAELLQQTRGQLQEELHSGNDIDYLTKDRIMGGRNMYTEDQINPRPVPYSSCQQMRDHLQTVQTPQGIYQYPNSQDGIVISRQPAVVTDLHTLAERQHQQSRHQGSGSLLLSNLSHSVVESPRNLGSDQEARSVGSSALLSNDAFVIHRNVQPSTSIQNVDCWHDFYDNYSVDKLLSYHKKHLFRNFYRREVLDHSKVLSFNNFSKFLGRLSIAEFCSSWQVDKYIVPSKFKTSAPESSRAHLEWTRPDSISQYDSCDPAECPSTSTYEEDPISYRVKLPLNQPRYFPHPSSILEESARLLKRKKIQENVQSKNKVSTTVHYASSSNKNSSNTDTLDADFCYATDNCSAQISTLVKTELKEVGRDIIIPNGQCLPDSTVAISDDESICKTETFLEEEDCNNVCDMAKIKYE